MDMKIKDGCFIKDRPFAVIASLFFMFLLLASSASQAATVYDWDGFSSFGPGGYQLALTDTVELEAGAYSASVLNLGIVTGFNPLVFALIDSTNQLVFSLVNTVADNTVSEPFNLTAGTYHVVLAGVSDGLAYGRAQLTAVPLPPAIWMLATALGGLAVVGRRRVAQQT